MRSSSWARATSSASSKRRFGVVVLVGLARDLARERGEAGAIRARTVRRARAGPRSTSRIVWSPRRHHATWMAASRHSRATASASPSSSIASSASCHSASAAVEMAEAAFGGSHAFEDASPAGECRRAATGRDACVEVHERFRVRGRFEVALAGHDEEVHRSIGVGPPARRSRGGRRSRPRARAATPRRRAGARRRAARAGAGHS